MSLIDDVGELAVTVRPHVRGRLPGPRSAELLARQERRESNARVYGRHLPIAVDGGVGQLRPGRRRQRVHRLPDRRRRAVAGAQPPRAGGGGGGRSSARFCHGLDLPTPAKDAFTEAQLSMLPAAMRNRTKVHFCGPTGANAVDAAIKLCKTATGPRRRRRLPGRVPRHHPPRDGAHRAGREQGAGRTTGCPGCTSSRSPTAPTARSGCRAPPARPTASQLLERSLRDPNGGIPRPAAVIVEMVQGEGGVVPADPDFVRRLRRLTRELDVPLVVDEVQTGCGRTGTWFAFEQYGIEPDVDRGLEGAVRDRPAGGDHPVRRAAGRVGAGRPHRHVPRQPAGLRRRRGGSARSCAATTCWATCGRAPRRSRDRLDVLRHAPVGAGRPRPRADVGDRAGGSDRRPPGRRAGRAGAGAAAWRTG